MYYSFITCFAFCLLGCMSWRHSCFLGWCSSVLSAYDDDVDMDLTRHVEKLQSLLQRVRKFHKHTSTSSLYGRCRLVVVVVVVPSKVKVHAYTKQASKQISTHSLSPKRKPDHQRTNTNAYLLHSIIIHWKKDGACTTHTMQTTCNEVGSHLANPCVANPCVCVCVCC